MVLECFFKAINFFYFVDEFEPGKIAWARDVVVVIVAEGAKGDEGLVDFFQHCGSFDSHDADDCGVVFCLVTEAANVVDD